MTDVSVTGVEATGLTSVRVPWAFTWGSIANTNGVPVQAPGRNATLQLTGTFGGTVVLQGSNDGTNYFTLNDRNGNAISATSAGIFNIVNLPAYVRPSGGTGVTAVIPVLVVTPLN